VEPQVEKHEGVRYESSDASAPALARFMLFLVLATVAIALLVRVMYFSLAHREAQRQPPPPILGFEANREPPLPRLQPQEGPDLEAYEAEQKLIVTTYAWVDKSHGIVRIPVDEAMRLLLKRGLPVGKDASSAPPEDARGGKK
jgi:hypothetical protein